MKNYMIQVTSPANPPQHFTVHIVPSHGQPGAIIRETTYTSEDVLKNDLAASLAPDIDIVSIIREAREQGVCDLRDKNIRLTDESAKRLGWLE